MAIENLVVIHNLTSNTITGQVKIGSASSASSAFGPLDSGSFSAWLQFNDTTGSTECTVTVNDRKATGSLNILGGAQAYLVFDVTENGFVNMYASAASTNQPLT